MERVQGVDLALFFPTKNKSKEGVIQVDRQQYYG